MLNQPTMKTITRENEPWRSLSKILAFRWHVNTIENLLMSLYAEHPVSGFDRYRDERYTEFYTEIWKEISRFEEQLRVIKRKHLKPGPEVRLPGSVNPLDCGCSDDNDCFDDWWCDEDDWLCHPPPKPGDDGSLESPGGA